MNKIYLIEMQKKNEHGPLVIHPLPIKYTQLMDPGTFFGCILFYARN